VNENGYDGLRFLEDFPQFAKDYREVLPAYSKNSSLVKTVYEQFKISLNSNDLFLKALREYQDLNLIDKSIPIQSIHTVNNLTIAYEQGLPRLGRSAELLINATKLSKDIVDFEPIVIEDVIGNKIVIQSSNLTRDYWMIANLLKERPALASQPEKFEWINRMIQQIAWNIFDDKEHGCNARWVQVNTGEIHLPENLTAKDQRVWEVILGFHDYMDSLPSMMEKDGLPLSFRYWDSNLLKKDIPDKTNRTMALLCLAVLPTSAYDRDTYKIVTGINATKLFDKRLPQMYEWLVTTWKNPDSEDYRNAMTAYKMWLQDRAVHGLEETVKQFSGVWPFEQEGTIDDFLNKNWDKWKFVKFPYDYLSGRLSYGPDFNIPNYGEWEMYRYELPLAYKAVGIPHSQGIGASATSGNFGGPGCYGHVEFTIYGIPQSVINNLSSQNLGRVAIGYGNGISLMSCIDGVEKDTGYEIFQWDVRGRKIYLWKK
jgi:hypothetical protein